MGSHDTMVSETAPGLQRARQLVWAGIGSRWFRVVSWPFRECWWWMFRLGRQVIRWPGRMAASMGAGLLALMWGPYWLPELMLAPFLLVGLWARILPVGFDRQFTRRLYRSRTRKRLVRVWPEVMHGCGLTRPGRPRVPGLAASMAISAAGQDPRRAQPVPPLAPALESVSWDQRGQLHLRPRLLVGQTVEDVQAVSERLRTSLDATRLRIVPNAADTACELVGMFGDPLLTPFNTVPPDPVTAVAQCNFVEMGITENGDPFRLPVRVSTLTAGKSGSGKASAMHNLIIGLAPAAKTGLVQLHGIDLKGGMELGMCSPVFTRLAKDVESAVILLEEAVQACEQRALAMAGVSRSHTPTTAEPLVVVVIDELSSLVGYVTDRDLLKRAETASAGLLAIGRAPGFIVHAFLQDPRKEVVKARNLFNQFIALRLDSREEVVMIMGDGAVEAGARAHKINPGHQGVGYAKDETGRIVRIRFGNVDDTMLRTVGRLFPAPRQIPIERPVPDETEARPARPPRTPRAPRNRKPAGPTSPTTSSTSSTSSTSTDDGES